METKTLTFTEQEANTLIELLDVANKTAGLKVSRACVHFHNKVMEAFNTIDEVTETETTENVLETV